MRNLTAVFAVLVVLLIISVKPIHAQSFTRSPSNPLVVNTDFSGWEQKMVFHPHVMYEEGVFKMWFSSFNGSVHKIAYATSTDGMDWTTQKLLDVAPIGQSGVGDPDVFKKDGVYYLYFSVFNDKNEIYRLASADGINYDQNSLKKIVSYEKNWEREGVFAPTAAYLNGQYYLFYIGWSGIGKLGLMVSSDNQTWIKCSDFLFSPIDAPSYFEKNGRHFLFFHNDLDIEQLEITYLNGCEATFANQKQILANGTGTTDNNRVTAPAVIDVNASRYLYYIARGDDMIWRLHLATQSIPADKVATIIIPGLMASWNSQAILHNQSVNQSEWKLPAFVKDYQGLIDSFNNHGFAKDEDYFIFAYDWRQSLENTVDVLDQYLNAKIWGSSADKRINIVGHSLGGLVGKIYTQTHPDKVNKLITVGSPHQGATQAYKPLSAGEIDRDNTWLWLAEKLILVINKNEIETDRVTVNRRFPVLLDLFPTYDFLTDELGGMIKVSSLSIKNPTLPKYADVDAVKDKLSVIYGTNRNTIKGYVVKTAGLVNRLLGNYADGEPIDFFDDDGDGTVLSKSALTGDEQRRFSFSLNHGAIISQIAPQEKIFQQLEIPYNLGKIAAGAPTQISPSLIFLIRSPAQINVEYKTNKYPEEDGLIFIENAESGDYKLNIQGTASGKYQVIIGQTSQTNDIWETLDGEIIAESPQSQIDSYQFYFDSQTAQPIFPSPTLTVAPTATPAPTASTPSSPSPTLTLTPTSTIILTPTPTPSPTAATSNAASNSNSPADQLNTSNSSSADFPVRPDLNPQDWNELAINDEKPVSPTSVEPKPQVLGTAIKKRRINILIIFLALIAGGGAIYLVIAHMQDHNFKNKVLELLRRLRLLVNKSRLFRRSDGKPSRPD